jgi:hypothetical protein
MGQALTPQQTLQAAQRVDALRAQEENSNHPDNPEVAWWCKLLAKAAGVIGGGSKPMVFIEYWCSLM